MAFFLLLSFLVILLIIFNERLSNYWKSLGVPFIPATDWFSREILESLLITRQRLKDIYEQVDEPVTGFYVLRRPILLLRDPKIIYQVFTSDFKDFLNKRQGGYIDRHSPLSQHLLSLRSAEWKTMRTSLSPSFTAAKLKHMYANIEEVVDAAVSRMEGDIEIKAFSEELSTEIFTSCAFGVKEKSLEGVKLVEIGKAAFDVGYWKTLKAFFRMFYPKVFKTLGLKSMERRVGEVFCGFVKNLMDERLASGRRRSDFIQILTDLREEGKDFTDERIAAQAYSFFIGGYETTSGTMLFTLYEVAKNPDVANKIRQEVEELKKENATISYDDIMDMKYTHNVIEESLRLHPPTFFTNRISRKAGLLPGTNYFLDKGTFLIVPISQIHRDPEYFPNPNQFYPERFSRYNRQQIPNGAYLPFGDGPRKCIGFRFALLEVKLFLVKVLEEYDVKLVSPNELEYEEYARTLKVKGPVMVQCTRRSKNHP